ncbi:succinyl-diaminopimelate desuccinylase [Ureibacillus xyleni]|uniref:Succinyl-diaminopimelate desuccinylase n=1 Tax=Ureibacillus xyleni TaxID=614648 RepID=A0A285S8A7_9BACL|nr:dipeptidase PepV [Ureibacillus xyleni]SOC03445.1 succinyl-diaminopimelate desuccinylase [Ureibacillus xyleni]
MDWLKLAQSREEELILELQQLIQIESVLDEANATKDAPFGPGPLKALQYMLQKGEELGFTTKNVDEVAGHIEMGQGDELVGILCHVDVVPAGDSWVYPPFKGEIVDGKLYGRGAIDDKGPTIAAWLAMKMIKDEQIPLNKRVRMIIGTDEESGFRCVNHYFKNEEMPSNGFAPDADFPLINAEKGIALLDFELKEKFSENEQLVAFQSGQRSNMVPDFAKAIIQNVQDGVVDDFEQFLEKNLIQGTINKEENKYIVTVKGKSAHAMEPEKGINAGVLLAKFLTPYLNTTASKQFVTFIVEVFDGDHYGTTLNLNHFDEMSGQTTLNPGVILFHREKGARIQVSMRYSVTYSFEEKITKASQLTAAFGFSLDVVSNSAPHYIPEEDSLIQTLLSVYRKYTNDHSNPLSTGGGTYARVMKKGVAFGMLFPGEPDVAHQADEYVVVENLIKAAAIYAEAIVELAK